MKRGYVLLLAEHDILADCVKHLSHYDVCWALHQLAKARAKTEETLDYLCHKFDKPLYNADPPDISQGR